LLVQVEEEVVMMAMALVRVVVLVDLVLFPYQVHKHKVNHLILE
jgi:hypothetical protein